MVNGFSPSGIKRKLESKFDITQKIKPFKSSLTKNFYSINDNTYKSFQLLTVSKLNMKIGQIGNSVKY